MDKRYQVFVSSTFEDLQEERREVMQALLSLDCIPTGMELFPAADDESWELIERFIAGCDYYIVIVGGRYGSVGADGKSYTEMEYDYAVEAGLPVLAFLHGDPGTITENKTEATNEGKAALRAFRERIKAARHAKYWKFPKELPGLVALGVPSLMKIKPRVGSVRADQVADETASQEILGLCRKIDDLEAHIAESGLAAPTGTEELAQGEETISLHFRYADFTTEFVDLAVALSWNQILSVLGPILIIQASEGDLREKLAEVFRNKLEGSCVKVFYPSLVDEDFQKVKLQLRTLGLIQELKEKSLKAGDPAIWPLTPYGDRVMTKVAAIRSSVKP
jgi:hypothetical protein